MWRHRQKLNIVYKLSPHWCFYKSKFDVLGDFFTILPDWIELHFWSFACMRACVRACVGARVCVCEHLLLSKKMELDAFFGLSFESDEKILNDENEKPFQPNLPKKNLLEHHHFEKAAWLLIWSFCWASKSRNRLSCLQTIFRIYEGLVSFTLRIWNRWADNKEFKLPEV